MALIIKSRVVESSTTTGTGAFTLAGAYTGYRRFSAVCSTNDTVYYCIEAVDANGNPSGDWETGLGTYSSANTLTRTSVHESTNSNNAVNFAAGTKRVSLNVTATQASGFYASGGTDVALADGGTGASLVDPNADRIMFWDDSAGQTTWLSLDAGLEISGTTLRVAQGTSFPGSPASGDRFLRSDRNVRYYYDGTRWLSEQSLFLTTSLNGDNTASITSTVPNPWNGTYDIYVEEVALTTQVTSVGTWTGQWFSFDGSTATSVAASISTAGDAANTQITRKTTVNSVITSATEGFQCNWNRTSGTLRAGASIRYRLVG